MNFCEIAPMLVSERAPKGMNSFTRECQLWDPRKGRWVNGKIHCQGSDEYGLPTASEAKLHLGLIKLTQLKNNFNDPAVSFTFPELLELLRWPIEGKSYRRAKLGLLRLSAVHYVRENSWWDNRLKTWATRSFTILSDVELYDGRVRCEQGELFPSRIVWSQTIFEGYQAGYLRDIDLDRCLSFSHGPSLQISRFLGKRAYYSREWSIPLRTFAFAHAGLIGNYVGKSQLVRKLQPAIREVEAAGLLEPLPESKRYVRENGEWSIRLVIPDTQAVAEAVATVRAIDLPLEGDMPIAPDPSRDVSRGGSPDADAVAQIEALVRHGVTRRKAKALVAAYPADRIALQIEVLDWMTEHRPSRVAEPAGFLVRAIEDDYAPPKGFVPSAIREQHRQEAEAAHREAQEHRRRKAEEAEHARAEQDRLRHVWESLDPAQRTQLDAQALSAAEPGVVDVYREMTLPSLKDAFFRTSIREPFLRRWIDAQEGLR